MFLNSFFRINPLGYVKKWSKFEIDQKVRLKNAAVSYFFWQMLDEIEDVAFIFLFEGHPLQSLLRNIQTFHDHKRSVLEEEIIYESTFCQTRL